MIGTDRRHCSSATFPWREASNLGRRLELELAGRELRFRQAHRDTVLLEFSDPEFGPAGNSRSDSPFCSTSVCSRPPSLTTCRAWAATAISTRSSWLRLSEYVAQGAVGVHAAGVEHRVGVAGKRGETGPARGCRF